MNRKIVIAILVALGVGAAGGYLYRRHTKPTLEERMEGAGEDLRRAWKKATR